MGDVLEVMVDLPPMLKLGWFVFAAWSLAQGAWYYKARVPAAAPVKPARKRSRNSSARRPAVRAPRSARPAAGHNDSTELLTSLGLLQTPGVSQYGVPMSSAGQAGPTVTG